MAQDALLSRKRLAALVHMVWAEVLLAMMRRITRGDEEE
jgi:hypothetical protein